MKPFDEKFVKEFEKVNRTTTCVWTNLQLSSQFQVHRKFEKIFMIIIASIAIFSFLVPLLFYIYEFSILTQKNSNETRIPAKADVWQFIGNPIMKFQVFSAYFDDVYRKWNQNNYFLFEFEEICVVEVNTKAYNRTVVATIRVIAILLTNFDRTTVRCHFRYRDGVTVILSATDLIYLAKFKETYYSPVHIICPIVEPSKQDYVEHPLHVGITSELHYETDQLSHFIKIRWGAQYNLELN